MKRIQENARCAIGRARAHVAQTLENNCNRNSSWMVTAAMIELNESLHGGGCVSV